MASNPKLLSQTGKAQFAPQAIQSSKLLRRCPESRAVVASV
jgi:hypothetical protein